MILPEQPDAAVIPLLNRLQRWRFAARLVLGFERLWPALWPMFGVAGGFVVLALLDLPRRLPAVLHLALLIAFALLLLGALVQAVRQFRLPDRAAADRRLEQASGLRHRPLAAIADQAAVSGAPTLWAAHLTRAAAQIQRLRVGAPRPGLAARDRWALRAALLIALVASLTIAGEQAGGRLGRALHPAPGLAAAGPAVQIQAWITPPAYAAMAPIFLKPDSGPASVPAGSQLRVNLTAADAPPQLLLPGATQDFRALDKTSFQADAALNANGRVTVQVAGHTLAGWDITVVADAPPEVKFPEPPGFVRGRPPSTRLPWQVAHRYGVASLAADLRLHDRPGKGSPLVINIPLPTSNPKAARGVRLQDLTAHPWAGLQVDATLVAKSVSGLVGSSADITFTLPERSFQHPIARALIAVRKMITLKPEDRAAAIHELARLSLLPDAWQADSGAYLNLRAIVALLATAPRPAPDASPDATIDESQTRLWTLALHLEEGAAERTARELARAEQLLKEALDAEQHGAPTDPAEIERRARALQDALRRNLQALADQAQRDPDSNLFDPKAHRLDARDMQRLAEQLRAAAARDRMGDARDKLAELDKLLQALRGRPEFGKQTERERQRAEQRQRGRQQMSVLGDLVRREGALLDHAQSRADAVLSRYPGWQLPGRPAVPAPAPQDQLRVLQAQRAAERQQDAPIQQALRRVLGELMQEQADLTDAVPDNLGDADAAMRAALAALAASDDTGAGSAEQRAIEALQTGGRKMSQEMARQFGSATQEGADGQDGQGNDMSGDQGFGNDGQGQDGAGNGHRFGPGYRNSGRGMDRRAEDRRDPLGRSLQSGASGRDNGNDVPLPDEMEQARTRAIQQELRRRSADRTRPQLELDYLDRLLRTF